VTPSDSSVGLRTATPYSAVLGNRELVAMLSARLLSGIGDQAARAVLALYVITEGSGDALSSALVLAVAYVPATFGFAFLGSVADRFPRRTVILVSDVARALLIGVLALIVSVESPLWLLLLVLFAAEMFAGPAVSARGAMMPDAARDRGEYQAAVGLGNTIDQVVQVVGFLLGGVAVAALNAASALVFDAFTFVVSFVLVIGFVHHRGVSAESGTSVRRLFRDLADGLGTVGRRPALRATALFAWAAAGLLVATDAVALPYAAQLGGGAVAATGLLAATPAGAAIAAVLVARLPLVTQVRIAFPLAIVSTVPLLATAAEPGLELTWVLWFLAGLCQGYAVTLMTLVVVLTSEERRGRVTGVVGAGFNAAAIVALVGLGALADASTPAAAVVLAGAAGLVAFVVLGVAWPRRDMRQALRSAYGAATRSL
jgi:hypothetical protein